MNKIINSLLDGIQSPLQKSALTCEPVSLTMAGLAAAGAATQIMGQRAAQKSAKSVEEARRIESENQISETRRRTTNDYLNQTRLEQEQMSQEESAVAVKSGDVNRETHRAVSTSLASAAERGIAGRNVEQIASSYEFEANEETGRLKQQQAMANAQHNEQIKGYGTAYSNRIADARPYVQKPIAPVDYFGPIFGAGAQTLGTYTQVKAIENK